MTENKVLKKILVVDDDQDILSISEYALQLDDSLTIKCLLSGEEALKEVFIFQPDLILLDIMMPKMDGMSLIKRLHSLDLTSPIPVIFFTAKTLPDISSMMNEAGAQGVIFKPFDPLTLAADIQKIWYDIVK